MSALPPLEAYQEKYPQHGGKWQKADKVSLPHVDEEMDLFSTTQTQWQVAFWNLEAYYKNKGPLYVNEYGLNGTHTPLQQKANSN